MNKSTSIKKVLALIMTIVVILVVNTAISNTSSIIGVKLDKPTTARIDMITSKAIPAGKGFAADAGLPVPGPRPSRNIAADAGLPVPGPRPSSNFAADAGLPVPGPRPSGDFSSIPLYSLNATPPTSNLSAKTSFSVAFASKGGSFPTAPRPTI